MELLPEEIKDAEEEIVRLAQRELSILRRVHSSEVRVADFKEEPVDQTKSLHRRRWHHPV